MIFQSYISQYILHFQYLMEDSIQFYILRTNVTRIIRLHSNVSCVKTGIKGFNLCHTCQVSQLWRDAHAFERLS